MLELGREGDELINIYIVLLPNVLMLDVVGPAEVFNFANRYSDKKFELHFISEQSDIQSSMGLMLRVDPLPEQIKANSWLLIPGLEGEQIDFSMPEYQGVVQWVNRHQQFDKVISVCSGTLLLAYCRLLDGKQCTTHFADLKYLQALAPCAQIIQNRLFIQDGRLYTSAGVSAGIDLALYLVEKECGIDCAANIARNMVLFNRRGEQDPALSPWLIHRSHLHQGIHNVQDAMQQDPSRDWRVSQLADIAHCSPRHLARMFKEHTKISCKRYLQILRITLAKQLLNEKSLSVEQVAIKVGFNDVRQFRRIWQQYDQLSPASYKNCR